MKPNSAGAAPTILVVARDLYHCLTGILLAFALLWMVPAGHAQDWAGNFNSVGADGSVSISVIAQTDTAFYYGGSFTSFGTVTANRIVRVDKATGLISAMGGGIDGGTVRAIAIVDNVVYVGGSFNSAGGIAATNIAKWDGNAWSALGSGGGNGVNSTVNALAVMGTDLFVGGAFTVVNSGGSGTTPATAASKVAKWDGTAWSALGSGVGNGVGPTLSTRTVNALAVVGTDLYVGGLFTAANVGGTGANPEVAVNNLAKWDGNNWLPVGSGDGNGVGGNILTLVNGRLVQTRSQGILAMVVNGSDLIVGGLFASANLGGDTDEDPSVDATSVAVWNGSKWSGVGSDDAGYGVSFKVQALGVVGASLYAGGAALNVDDPFAVPLLARWDGSTWSDLGSGDGDGVNGAVNAMAEYGADLYVGGSFSRANFGGTGDTPEILANGASKWNGSHWFPAVTLSGDGLNGEVDAILDAGPVVYVGGGFTFAGITAANHVAVWHKATRTWSRLGAGVGGANGKVNALALIGGNLYAGGVFTSAGGIVATNIARWDGTNWNPLGIGVGAGSGTAVTSLAVSGDSLFVGGSFSNAGGVQANNIAVWDGSSWSSLGQGASNGADAQVNALVAIGAELYAGGAFGNAGGVAVNNVAKWDGSTWSPLGHGVADRDAAVYALAANGTDLYVGGHFGGANNANSTTIPVGGVAKWDGSSWSALGSASNFGVYSPENFFTDVNAIAVYGTNVYVGGTFGAVGVFRGSGEDDGSEILVNRIARWNGHAWSALGSGTGNNEFDSVTALSANGSDVYAGGGFTVAGGKGAGYISEYGPAVLAVEQPSGAYIGTGGSSDFGHVAKDATTSLSFIVRNFGPLDLTGPVVTVDGPSAGQFTVTTSPTGPLAPAGSTTFTVQFTPADNGLQTAALHLASNDPDHSPFNITVTGTGTGFNAPPVAGTDSINRPNNGPTVKVQVGTLLANDTDVDGDTLTLVSVGDALPAGSTVTLSGGFVLYAAPDSKAGNGSFTYTLSDGPGGHTVTGMVTVTEIPPTIADSGANATHFGFDGGQFKLTFLGVPSHGYRVQYTKDISGSTAWQEFVPPAVLTAPDSGVFNYIDADPPGPRRFYRAIPNP